MLLQATLHIYHEFHPEGLIKQPWNTYSSLVFFIPVIYWLYKLKGQYKTYWVVTSILPLLFLNGLGSTLFHARNGGMAFMMLDVLPPLLMLVFLTVFMWRQSVKSYWVAGAVLLAFLSLNFGNMAYHSQINQMARGVNIFYLINGTMVATPILLWLAKRGWHGWQSIASAATLIGLALIFRTLDYPTPNPFPEALPQGTHFLWHVTSALAVFPLGNFLMAVMQTSNSVERAKAS